MAAWGERTGVVHTVRVKVTASRLNSELNTANSLRQPNFHHAHRLFEDQFAQQPVIRSPHLAVVPCGALGVDVEAVFAGGEAGDRAEDAHVAGTLHRTTLELPNIYTDKVTHPAHLQLLTCTSWRLPPTPLSPAATSSTAALVRLVPATGTWQLLPLFSLLSVARCTSFSRLCDREGILYAEA